MIQPPGQGNVAGPKKNASGPNLGSARVCLPHLIPSPIRYASG